MAARRLDLPLSFWSSTRLRRSGAKRYSPRRGPKPSALSRSSFTRPAPAAPERSNPRTGASLAKLLVAGRDLAKPQGVEPVVERALDHGALVRVVLALDPLEQGPCEALLRGEAGAAPQRFEVVV